MPEVTAYLALQGVNEDWPGVITFDPTFARYAAGKRGRLHKLGAFICDRVTVRDAQKAIVVGERVYTNGYAAIRDGVPWASVIGEPYASLVKRHAAEPDSLADLP